MADQEDEGKKELRRQIRAIQADASLSATDKAKKIQAVMTANWRAAHPQAEEAVVQSAGAAQGVQLDESITYHDEKEHILGCKHYRRNCKLKAFCCGKLYTCRLCHDEVEPMHKIDRHATQQMYCMLCSTLQPVAKSCNKCNKEMSKYFCSVCKFFDDDPKKEIYHCDKCGLCRIGRGLNDDVFHCDECSVCLAIAFKDNHKHIHNKLHSDCPICSTFMFTSVSPVTYLACGHPIHRKCLDTHIRYSVSCPICFKSLGPLEELWAEYDALLATTPMPEEYKDATCTILCNDCEQKSDVRFHFYGHKCPGCGSYNTKTLATKGMPSGQAPTLPPPNSQ